MPTEHEGIMRFENTLPEDFDGVFYFTNASDEDFIGKWNGKEYIFKAGTRSPIVIPDHSPVQIQNIRKKFAKDWAEREFYKSTQYNRYLSQERNPDGSPRLNSIHQAASYSISDLTEFIQKCLEPLPAGRAIVKEAAKVNIEETLSRDEEGQLNTVPLDGKAKVSLREKAQAATGRVIL